MKRPCEKLSRRQRCLTPLPFARYLVERVLALHSAERVAVLWTAPRTLYGELWPLVDCWQEKRDARRYAGPWPVICHPPCGPWGRFSWKCKRQSKEHGILAIEFVHRWGGVVEQPVGSQLFDLHGRGGSIEVVNQGDYGHQALKPTLLYLV